MSQKIKSRLTSLSVGSIATLWDLLVWRVSETRWVVGHNSIKITDEGCGIDEAAEKFERLLD